MKKAPNMDSETIKNGVGNWVLFFCTAGRVENGGLGEDTGVRVTPSNRVTVFWCSGGREYGRGESL